MDILKYKNHPFRIFIFFFSFILICIWTAFAFIAVFAKDEGTIGDGIFINFVADTFIIVSFPSILLSGLVDGTPELIFVGLFINTIFHAFIFERLITIGLIILQGDNA